MWFVCVCVGWNLQLDKSLIFLTILTNIVFFFIELHDPQDKTK